MRMMVCQAYILLTLVISHISQVFSCQISKLFSFRLYFSRRKLLEPYTRKLREETPLVFDWLFPCSFDPTKEWRRWWFRCFPIFSPGEGCHIMRERAANDYTFCLRRGDRRLQPCLLIARVRVVLPCKKKDSVMKPEIVDRWPMVKTASATFKVKNNSILFSLEIKTP